MNTKPNYSDHELPNNKSLTRKKKQDYYSHLQEEGKSTRYLDNSSLFRLFYVDVKACVSILDLILSNSAPAQ